MLIKWKAGKIVKRDEARDWKLQVTREIKFYSSADGEKIAWADNKNG